MELRDQFAMAAMQGLLAGDTEGYEGGGTIFWHNGEIKAERLARQAYLITDAMLEAKGPKKQIPMPTDGQKPSGI